VKRSARVRALDGVGFDCRTHSLGERADHQAYGRAAKLDGRRAKHSNKRERTNQTEQKRRIPEPKRKRSEGRICSLRLNVITELKRKEAMQSIPTYKGENVLTEVRKTCYHRFESNYHQLSVH
jgi:hypothetical protein